VFKSQDHQKERKGKKAAPSLFIYLLSYRLGSTQTMFPLVCDHSELVGFHCVAHLTLHLALGAPASHSLGSTAPCSWALPDFLEPQGVQGASGTLPQVWLPGTKEQGEFQGHHCSADRARRRCEHTCTPKSTPSSCLPTSAEKMSWGAHRHSCHKGPEVQGLSPAGNESGGRTLRPW
jgi:hypothetical protein